MIKVSNTVGFGDLHDVDAEFEKVYRSAKGSMNRGSRTLGIFSTISVQ